MGTSRCPEVHEVPWDEPHCSTLSRFARAPVRRECPELFRLSACRNVSGFLLGCGDGELCVRLRQWRSDSHGSPADHHGQQRNRSLRRSDSRDHAYSGWVDQRQYGRQSWSAGLLDDGSAGKSGSNVPDHLFGRGQPELHDHLCGGNADDHSCAVDDHREQLDPRRRRAESCVHSHVCRLRERRHGGVAHPNAGLHHDRRCHEPGRDLPDHVLGADIGQLHDHLRAWVY